MEVRKALQALRAEMEKSLSLADEVILLPIYPARELPIEGVTSEILLEKITSKDKKVLPKNEIPAYLKKLAVREVICVMGAGDVDSILKDL